MRGLDIDARGALFVRRNRRVRLPHVIGAGLLFVLLVVVIVVVARRGEHHHRAPHAPTTLPNSLNLAIVGDWGRNGKYYQTDVANAMGTSCVSSGCAAVISTGDQFYDNGVTSLHDPLWRSSWADVYTAPSLRTVPWHLVLGNHDYRGNVTAQLLGHLFDPAWHMPSRFYNLTFNAGGASGDPSAFTAAFIFLDTNVFVEHYWERSDMGPNLRAGPNATQQLAWLDSVLASPEVVAARWLFVVGHHPLYSAGGHGDNPGVIEALADRLVSATATAFIAGHDHDVQHRVVSGVHHFVSGAGSEVRNEPTVDSGGIYLQATGAFLHASINKTHAVLEFIDHSSALLKAFSATSRG